MKPILDQIWISQLFNEDLPNGDVASSFVPPSMQSRGLIEAQEDGFVAGTFLIEPLLQFLSSDNQCIVHIEEGQAVQKGDKIASIEGNTQSILRAERTILNLLSYLSGITSQTRRFTDITNPNGVKLLDTRKTLPGYRSLVKYAVQCGNGFNHRNNLSDLILIKNNHITALGGISNTLKTVNEDNKNPMLKVEVEVRNCKEALEALAFNPDIIMLDNFSVEEAEEALFFIRGKAQIEISGNITLDNIARYSSLKPDFISVGSDLTMKTNPLSMHLLLQGKEASS